MAVFEKEMGKGNRFGFYIYDGEPDIEVANFVHRDYEMITLERLPRYWEQIWEWFDIEDFEGELFVFDSSQNPTLYRMVNGELVEGVEEDLPPHRFIKWKGKTVEGHKYAVDECWQKWYKFEGKWWKDYQYEDIMRYLKATADGYRYSKPPYYK